MSNKEAPFDSTTPLPPTSEAGSRNPPPSATMPTSGLCNATKTIPAMKMTTSDTATAPPLHEEVQDDRSAQHVDNGGSTPNSTNENLVPFDLVKIMMREMMTTLLDTTSVSSTATSSATATVPQRGRNLEHIYLPAFDPDDRTDTVKVWCKHLEELKHEYTLNDRETLNLARKNLRGRAAEWSRRNYTQLSTWQAFKDILIETFADESRYYDDLVQFMEYTSEQADTLADYASKKWELAKRAVGVEMTEQRLVEAVITGMSNPRIRSDLLRLTPKNLPQLVQNLNSYKRKKNIKDTDHYIPTKRFKPIDTNLRRCHKCQKLGHVQKDCPTLSLSKLNDSNTMKNQPYNQHRTCSFCQKKGHSSENCFKRLNNDQKNGKEINEKICQ